MKKAALIRFLLVAFCFALLQSCGEKTVKSQSQPQSVEHEHPEIQAMLETEYVEGRLLVRFKEQFDVETDFSFVSDKFDEWGVSARHAYYGELTGLYCVEGDFRVSDLLPKVLSDPQVSYAEPDYRIELAYQPNDPYAQSGMTEAYHHDIIHSYEAWDLAQADPSLVVAVTDTGCLTTHEELVGNMWVNTAEANGISGVDDDGNGFIDDVNGWNCIENDSDVSGEYYHGTFVASLIAGSANNNKGIAGVAYGCKIAALKLFSPVWVSSNGTSGGGGDESTAIMGMQYCVKMGFKIVNASWGLRTSKYGYIPKALDDAVTEMNNNGTLLVTSAGNDGIDVDDDLTYPVCYPHENIIGVMATDRNDEVTSWTNWGLPQIDLAAPGKDIFAADIPSGYRNSSGTSFSSPLVAGACALLWSKYPTMTHLQIKQLILENVDVLPVLAGKCVTEGRLNIKKALEAGGDPTGPSANFIASPTSGTVPHYVQFTDTSIGQVDSWSWDFDCDGIVDSSAQIPNYTYDSEGTYSVSLTVDGPLGSDTRTKTGYITVSADAPPVADFTADPQSGDAPLLVQFTDTSIGSVDSWSWDFDLDGIVDSSSQNPNYTYNSVGAYSVSLTVSGPLGSDTKTITGYITVTLPSTPLQPTADFSINTTSGEAPLTVQFTDTSSGSVTSWSWDFDDDGNVDSVARHPEHTYISAGTYSVSLTVSGPSGSDTEIKTGLITVSDSTVPGAPNSTGFNIERKKSGGCSLGTAPSTPQDITGQLLPLLSLFGLLFIFRLKEIRRRLMMLMLSAQSIRRS